MATKKKQKDVVFQIIESGHIHGETYCNIEHGNGEITFTSELKTTVKSNVTTARNMIKAIQSGRVRIEYVGLNGKVEKKYEIV